jgi:hypothetical protein
MNRASTLTGQTGDLDRSDRCTPEPRNGLKPPQNLLNSSSKPFQAPTSPLLGGWLRWRGHCVLFITRDKPDENSFAATYVAPAAFSGWCRSVHLAESTPLVAFLATGLFRALLGHVLLDGHQQISSWSKVPGIEEQSSRSVKRQICTAVVSSEMCSANSSSAIVNTVVSESVTQGSNQLFDTFFKNKMREIENLCQMYYNHC